MDFEEEKDIKATNKDFKGIKYDFYTLSGRFVKPTILSKEDVIMLMGRGCELFQGKQSKCYSLQIGHAGSGKPSKNINVEMFDDLFMENKIEKSHEDGAYIKFKLKK